MAGGPGQRPSNERRALELLPIGSRACLNPAIDTRSFRRAGRIAGVELLEFISERRTVPVSFSSSRSALSCVCASGTIGFVADDDLSDHPSALDEAVSLTESLSVHWMQNRAGSGFDAALVDERGYPVEDFVLML
jgi:hypothetical protein